MFTKVTISGTICSGKTTLFWDLYQKLHWPTFSASHFFRDFARTHHVSLQKAEEQDASLTKVIDYGMQQLLNKEQNVILEGWMAGIMADRITGVLKILLICSDSERVKRFSEREKIDPARAKKKVAEREQNVYGKLKQIYKRDDFLDPKNYDVVIDTTDKTPLQVLQLVLNKLNN